MRITQTYEVVPFTGRQATTCPDCGKKRRIQRTFTQTINPFNRNEDGTVRTFSEVYWAVARQAQDWIPSDRERQCTACATGREAL